MLYHVYKADGINHVLFHMEQSDGWEYSFRQVGAPKIPDELTQWSEPIESHQRKILLSPHAPGFPVEVRWRKCGSRRWRKAALRHVGECWLDVILTAVQDVSLKDFDKGVADFRLVALVRGDVAAYVADIDSLELKKGRSMRLKFKAAYPSVNNVITDDDVFFNQDHLFVFESVGSTRKAFIPAEAPAVAVRACENSTSFIVRSGGRMSKDELDELMDSVKGDE